MTKRIIVRPKAGQDLDDHFAYIAENNFEDKRVGIAHPLMIEIVKQFTDQFLEQANSTTS